MDLTVVWAVIIAFAVAMYVVMDGFDLGIGILSRLQGRRGAGPGDERDRAGLGRNETWLVLGGGGLMAAFPLAYAIVLPALYAPLIAMLLGLVFRGVAFEFRWRDPRHRRVWDLGFCLGSLVATFAQGITLGALLQGIEIGGRAYAGGWWDWLTPFSLLTGASLVVAYALLGATWLIWKTEGGVQSDARRYTRWLLPAFLLLVCAVSLATPFLEGQYFRRWFEWPGLALVIVMTILFGGLALIVWDSAGHGPDGRPFAAALGMFALTLAGLGVSIWPDVIPGRITIWQAAAPYESQLFMLVGALILLPLILAYTAWSYWVFRGKVGAHGYH